MKRFSAALFLVLGLAVFAAPPAGAAGPSVLTDDIRQGLMALKSLGGPALDRETFNGKPLLVVFWSSW